ncbi:type II CAAX prenyl endopeptidase Rce1 family protein [Sphingomonas sp.]|uniref:CPBP family glutamic-type intramembrane protease n=1 Tax=Sphingomonas sp. TaxID=28214 RepID=UPI002DB6374F|nr:CPBP family glutamic-type intramembrane protease [Sphingomonas sp.]HEU4968472.1 CPBP family glutamic-type intramembrane protease [Sphingomonas sp.]
MRTWHVLAIGGAAGVLSLLALPIEQLVPANPLPRLLLRALALIQPAILVAAAVGIGAVLAPRVGLEAPLSTALARRQAPGPVLRRQAGPAILVGLVTAAVLIAYRYYAATPMAGAGPVAQRLAAFDPPLVTRLLYGGIAEELLTRWGLVSLFGWAMWRLAGRPQVPSAGIYWAAIALAALLFAAGHLPLLFLLAGSPPAWLIAAVLAGNALPGLLFGWLFWRRGLEAAMIAHAVAHLIAWLAG